MESVLTLTICILSKKYGAVITRYIESLVFNLLVSCIYFSINFWKKLHPWIFAAGENDSFDSLKGKYVYIASRVGNKHEIIGQNVLFTTGNIIAWIHTCSEWVVSGRYPKNSKTWQWVLRADEEVMQIIKAIGNWYFSEHRDHWSKVSLKVGCITSSEALVAIGVLRWSRMYGLSWCLGQNAACMLWVSVLSSAAIFSQNLEEFSFWRWWGDFGSSGWKELLSSWRGMKNVG